jgi:esterase/lipase
MLRYSFGCLNMDDPVQASTYHACSVAPTKKVWKYLAWIPRILELFKQMHRVSAQLPQIRVPLIAWQSQIDGMVSNRSASALQTVPTAEVHLLNKSSHFFYDPEETERIRSRFRDVLF